MSVILTCNVTLSILMHWITSIWCKSVCVFLCAYLHLDVVQPFEISSLNENNSQEHGGLGLAVGRYKTLQTDHLILRLCTKTRSLFQEDFMFSLGAFFYWMTLCCCLATVHFSFVLLLWYTLLTMSGSKLQSCAIKLLYLTASAECKSCWSQPPHTFGNLTFGRADITNRYFHFPWPYQIKFHISISCWWVTPLLRSVYHLHYHFDVLYYPGKKVFWFLLFYLI